jgi:CDP-diacylglycerol pyrophosphatase
MKINITLLFTWLQSNTKNQDNDQNIPVDKIMINCTKQYGRTCDNIKLHISQKCLKTQKGKSEAENRRNTKNGLQSTTQKTKD